MTISEIYDSLKAYIDTKLHNLSVAYEQLFIDYKTKEVGSSIDNVNIVGTNIDNVKTTAMAVTNKVSTTIDTIDALRALTITPSSVWVSGYYTKGDGAFGSHIFEWDATSTEADNDGTIVKLTNIDTGRYKLKYSGAVNVKWFGTKGDGITNDTFSIQNALNSSFNIYFPKGIYILTSSLLIPNIGTFLLQGIGTETIIKADPTTPDFDLIDINENNGPLKTFRNIAFNGPQAGSYGAGAAIGGIGNGVRIDNCWFAGIKYGVKIQGSFVSVYNSTFEYCFYGIYDETPIENSYFNNTFYKDETDIYISGTAKSTIVNGVSAIGTKTDIIRLMDSVGLIISNISAENDGTSYTPTILHIGGTSTNNIISNIRTNGFGNYLVFLEGAGNNNNIFSNLIANNITYGIFVSIGSKNRFINGRFDSCIDGVRCDSALGNTFNTITSSNCTYGFDIISSTDCRFVECDATNSTTKGIYAPTTTTVYTNGCFFDSKDISGTEKTIVYT